jgi:hypothetical protein
MSMERLADGTWQSTGDGPMHEWFSLSYASYLVVPRSWIQEMPIAWQQRLRDCLEELEQTLDVRDPPGGYRVQAIGERGRFISDPWREYRHGPVPERRARRRTE